MMYTIRQLATLAGISVRTLHFYDEIGLLKPGQVKANGYRSYGEKELVRLQQILFFRELAFSLGDIQKILASPEFDTIEALHEQKKMLEVKKHRIENLLHTITNTITSMRKKKPLQEKEMYDAFKDDEVKEYQAEAKKRWGHTDAYKQSMMRVGKMTKQEMEKLKADGKVFTQKLADSMDKGPAHSDVQALIAQHHEGINFFYDCSYTMYRGLGEMYVADPRFTAYYEKFRVGLAQFMREAINIYCDHHEAR